MLSGTRVFGGNCRFARGATCVPLRLGAVGLVQQAFRTSEDVLISVANGSARVRGVFATCAND